MSSFKASTKEKGKRKLKHDDKLLEVINITINVGCFDIPR
jgi:hypothetical protein